MAKLPIDYHPEARQEADVAFDWYRDRSLLVAERFRRELEHAQTAIQDFPDAWAEYLYGTRVQTISVRRRVSCGAAPH